MLISILLDIFIVTNNKLNKAKHTILNIYIYIYIYI